jgi:glucose-6-phosphate 1-dehydrogenase
MSDKISDALVFFGATGELNMPVIGVAKSGWTLEQLKQRAQDSVDRFRGVILNSFKDILNQSITLR